MSFGGREFALQGTAMPKFRPRYFDTRSTISNSGQARDAIGNADSENTGGLRYSSPRPWILAFAISLAMWAFMAWLIWGR
jgi:hypothetical protein